MIAPLPLAELARRCNGSIAGDASHSAMLTGVAIDSRAVKSGDLFVAIKGDRVDGHDFIPAANEAGAVAAMVTTPVSCPSPQLVVDDPLTALAEFGRAIRETYRGTLIGITGSAGKTTAKNLLASILSAAGRVVATEGNLNNELGVPLTLARLEPETEFAVLELGAGKPGDIAWLCDFVRPNVGVLLNVGPAHLEFYPGIDAIADTKGAIVEGLGADGLAVVNADQQWSEAWRRRSGPARVLTFGRSEGADVRALDIVFTDAGATRFTLQTPVGSTPVDVKIAGRSGVDNALAASAVAVGLGVSLSVIRRGLAAVAAGPGRGSVHVLPGNVTLIDDSYNANPPAVKAAIELLSRREGPRRLVLGDMLELGGDSEEFHQQIGRLARSAGIEELWTVGLRSEAAAASFGEEARSFPFVEAALKAEPAFEDGMTVLVKGSRGIALDRLVAHWQEALAPC